MRQVLLYEYTVSGADFCHDGGLPFDSLAPEGAAMLSAVAADFAAIDDVSPVVMVDRTRFEELPLPGCDRRAVSSAAHERELLQTLSAQADATLLIAPEFDRLLESRCRWVEEADGRLIGPSAQWVAIAADKHRTAERMAAAGVRAPAGKLIWSVNDLPAVDDYPMVLKPTDGAGSLGVRLLRGPELPTDFVAIPPGKYRIEPWIPGTPVSVSLLCGPRQQLALPPCYQRLSSDGRFRYLGGASPIDADLVGRAHSLAMRAVAALPGARGYVGVDLILGADPGGAGDAVIEINPRLTTSYIGLRARADCNLAAAMWQIATGLEATVSFRDRAVSFGCHGVIE